MPTPQPLRRSIRCGSGRSAFRTRDTTSALVLLLSTTLCSQSVRALDRSVPRIGGDISRSLLGDGTGVIVGVIDSGLNDTHPALSGVDSLGQPRLVAQRNFVPSEAGNEGEDRHGHGTAVAGVIAGSASPFLGLAPDVRLINARALNANNRFETGNWPENATGWAIDQGADILNLSLNFFSTGADSSKGLFDLDLLLDWAVYDADHRVSAAVCTGNIHDGAGGLPTVRSPGGAYNVITVGQTGPNRYSSLSDDSSRGPTSNGRIKPDIVAPGDSITTTSANWQSGDDHDSWTGCSFAAPHVAGVLAQLTEYGHAQQLSTDPLVLKAALMTGAEKVLNHLNQPWAPAESSVVDEVWQSHSPLDAATGAGQVDAVTTAQLYRAGQQPAGAVSTLGWDANMIRDTDGVDYYFDVSAATLANSAPVLSTTLTWMRHVQRNDDGNQQTDAADQYLVDRSGDQLDNLDLTLLLNDQPIARSVSQVDNVEHLYWSVAAPGRYTVRVDRQAVVNTGNEEAYAVAWTLTGFRGDFTADGVLASDDLDALGKAIRAAEYDSNYDLNADSVVDFGDLTVWVVDLKHTTFGDADLDGRFGTRDLVQVFQAGEYEDDRPLNSTWSRGDWNADGDFATSDLVVAFQGGGYEQEPPPVAPPVPEPRGLAIWLLGLIIRRGRAARTTGSRIATPAELR